MNISTDIDEDMYERAATLIENICSSDASDFYRLRWGSKKEFNELPFLAVDDLIRTPFSKRRYRTQKGLVKIIRRNGSPFFIQRSHTDIGEENYGSPCERPTILFTDNGDALEKSLWFYEHFILPLLGRCQNMAVAAHSAAWYGTDAIVSDADTLQKFLPQLKKIYDSTHIRTLTLIEKTFPPSTMKWGMLFQVVRILAGLPECGAFAEKCPESGMKPFFHADKNSLLEVHDGYLVVTKLLPLVTPIIRYKTELRATKTVSGCSCEKTSFIL
ncbi:MAG: hypothetical protein A2756_03365 [Candidatus Ryanbacteria bacterium RIFCSPHIGHO2_01_FULL_48_27]|uniref:Uncharacterized protein n=1 Tax=Candidatus Ryanbacteria bacterium RIFCSPHIGHO2_01_FULL_48_27 TaxID=1802115 RepID=A0A1G2G4F7_9BACT|nr:MAG: hypothetical protein A2756_03365 [Candidatus Ryanbacteria bacterium RIFCSPHIGHO2_01_FULL_48_27]